VREAVTEVQAARLETAAKLHDMEIRVGGRIGQLEVRVENLSVRAGFWGAIGGAVTLAVPLGMGILLWLLKG
jgi:hypothetical protein